MNFNEYQECAKRTGDHVKNQEQGLNLAALGLCGESGEFADIVKKVQHHKVDLDSVKLESLQKELGDVMWYIAHACNVMGWNMSDIAKANIEKLKKRYPNGFNTEDSIKRQDLSLEANMRFWNCCLE